MTERLWDVIGKREGLLKVSGLCGILGPVIAFTCVGVAVYYSPWFSWTENWLSDLGGTAGEKPIWAAHGIASVIFNVGLIITGIIGIVFAIGIRKSGMLNTHLGRLGTLFLLLNMSALCGVGIFPETTGYLHTLVSLVFFSLVPLSLLSIGTVVRKSSEKTLGWLTTPLGVISLCSFPVLFIPRPWGSNAVAEMVPSIAISIFSIMFSIRLLKAGLSLKDINMGTADKE